MSNDFESLSLNGSRVLIRRIDKALRSCALAGAPEDDADADDDGDGDRRRAESGDHHSGARE